MHVPDASQEYAGCPSGKNPEYATQCGLRCRSGEAVTKMIF